MRTKMDNKQPTWQEYSERNVMLKMELEELKNIRVPKEILERLSNIENSIKWMIELITNQKNSKSKKKKNLSKRLRMKILSRDNYTCQNCGFKEEGFGGIDPLHIDHIIPRKLGGTDDEKNLRVLCSSCNLMKAAHDFESLKNNRKKE